MPGKPSELGGYSFFRQQGHEPLPDDMHDGSPAFHIENVFGQNDSDPDPIRDTLGTAQDVRIIPARRLGRDALGLTNINAEQRKLEIRDNKMADEWARQNGFKL